MEKENQEPKVVPKQKDKIDKNAINSQKRKQAEQFKEEYFDYYDDIKHYSKGKEDW